MMSYRAGDTVEVVRDSDSYSDTGLNKALARSVKIPSGSFGSVVRVLTNTAGDGRVICVSFGGNVSYLPESSLKPVAREAE